MEIPTITPDEVVQRLEDGARIAFVDARSAPDHAVATHVIPGSIRAAPEQPFPHLSDVLQDAAIVVYCTCGQERSSARVALRLLGLGFRDVQVLRGGLDAWGQAGFPLEPLARFEATRNGADHQVMLVPPPGPRTSRLPPPGRTLRVVGIDDAPFARRRGARVRLVGAVCAGTRFEGLVLGETRRDGWGATDAVCRLLVGGKFLPQLHLVLLDGLGFGGLNLVDLEALSARLGRPCAAVMRRAPDLAAVERAVRRLPRPDRRLALLRRAGPVHVHPPFAFQVRGASPETIAPALARLSDRGHVPEALRLAHLIGSALATGESGRRA